MIGYLSLTAFQAKAKLNANLNELHLGKCLYRISRGRNRKMIFSSN